MATIIDATDAVMGRLASKVAKRLIEGESIVIVNSEKAVITGSRDNILENYTQKRERGTPRFGPYFPRIPHMIVKRAVRGMIPYQTPRGRAALKRLRVELGVPPGIGNQPLVRLKDVSTEANLKMTIGELSKDLGAKVRTQHAVPAPDAAQAEKPAKATKAAKPKAEKKVKA